MIAHETRKRLPLILFGIAAGLFLALRYTMPFRLDDVLHIDWAIHHSFWQAWDPIAGEIVRSFRPTFAATIWLLTYIGGMQHFLVWQLTLIFTMFGALYFAGRTSEWISGKPGALYWSTLLYPIAFLSTLNILFWYGDLTFTVELLFTAMAWLFGLRVLLSAERKLILPAILCGALAVMAKEPAIVLVNAVWVSAFILRFNEIKRAWRGKLLLPIAMLVVLMSVSLWILLASPTKSNRFFLLSDPQISFFIQDRLRYYGDVLLGPLSRVLLFFPQMALLFSSGKERDESLIWFGFGAALVLTFVLLQWPLVVMVFSPLSLILLMRHPDRRRAASLLLPFAICVSIFLGFLTVTIALTKSQLTELALAQLVITGYGWSEVQKMIWPLLSKRMSRVQLAGLLLVIVFLGGIFIIPKLLAREHLLGEVQGIRANANDAIQYMATSLPVGSTVAVTGYRLYGLGGGDELTSQDDELKLRSQYTFVQGYVRIYLRELGREDIRVVYIEDSVLAPLAVDSLRTAPHTYAFLQIEPDLRWFSSVRSPADSLLRRFSQGPYPSEVWRLGR